MNLISLFIAGLLTENVILTKFLGLCPLVGTTGKKTSAIGMGISVMFVIMCSSILTYLVHDFILIPTSTTYLTTIMFILIIACFVQIASFVIKSKFPKLDKLLGIYLPLITTNCAVLGITLLNVNSDFSFIEMLVYSFSSSLGFAFVLYLFSIILSPL